MGKAWKWDTVILSKTQELSRFILNKTDSLDFADPSPRMERSDSQDVRKKILELSLEKARELEIGKSTLCYLHKKADGEQSFKVYHRFRQHLKSLK